MSDFISVIISTLNKKQLLEKTLFALFNQTLNPKYYEIIVVDDGSTDGTKELVESYVKTHNNLRYFKQEHKGLPASRNLGISKAIGEIIAFTDHDCIPDKDWLKKIRETFKSNLGIAGIEGKVVTDKKRRLFSSAPENLNGNKFTGANMAFKKEIILKAGGYDEDFVFYREDTDMAIRVCKLGKIIFCPDIVIYHPAIHIPYLQPIKRLFLVHGDIRLFKKYLKEYSQLFGIVSKNELMQAFFAWITFSSILYSLISMNVLLFFLTISVIVAFKYFFGLKSKLWTPAEAIIFVIITYIRDLFFPIFFIYYYFTVNPTKPLIQ